jgi:hypothetical protein
MVELVDYRYGGIRHHGFCVLVFQCRGLTAFALPATALVDHPCCLCESIGRRKSPFIKSEPVQLHTSDKGGI